MPANLVTKTSDGLSDFTSVTFSNQNPGTPSSATAFRLLNDDSGGPVDDAVSIKVAVRQIDPADNEAKQSGLRAVDERWVEMRALGTGSSGSTQVATGWIPVGSGRYLELADLIGGEYHDLEIRFNPPGTAAEGDFDFLVQADPDGRILRVESGHTEASRDGVLSGIGDELHSEIVLGGTPTVNSPPDADIAVPDLAWVHKGVPYVLLAHTETLNDQDSAAATLAVGEAYWAVLSLGAGASITVTKSVKGTAPLDEANIPSTPTGEIRYCVIERPESGIDASAITRVADAGRFAFSDDGFVATIGPGKARIDNALITSGAIAQLTLNPSVTSTIWLLPSGDGLLEVTEDGSSPEPRAYKLYEVDTDSGSIDPATLVDYRDLIGAERIALQAEFEGTLSAGLDRHLVYPGARRGYLRVERGIVFRIHDAGSGNSAGIYKLDVTVGGTDAFTSKATDDRRASIEHDSSPQLSTGALPEVLVVDPFDSIVVALDEDEAYNGTGPSDASVVLIVDMP